MTLLSAVLNSPAVADAVEVIEPARDRRVSSVVLIEDVQALGEAPDECLAVLSTPVAAEATGYRLDLALRLASSSGVTALVLTADRGGGRTPATARSLASRADIWLLRADPKTPLASLIIAIDRAIEGQAADALDRLERLLIGLQDGEQDEPIDEILKRLSALYGRRFEIGGDSTDRGFGTPFSDDREFDVTVHAEGDRSDRISCDVAAALVASALTHSLETSRRAANMPVLSAAEVLTELLANPKGGTASLLRRARTLGLPIDGWHIALRVEFESAAEPSDASAEVSAFETRQAIIRSALDYVRSRGGDWYLAQSAQAFVLVRMYRNDPGHQAVVEVADIAHQLVVDLHSRFHDVELRCGVGSAHAGAAGLASTAMEARAAVVAARGAGRRDNVSKFDSAGLRRTLIEWYATDTARDAVRTVLQPLDGLGEAKRDAFILTLKTFLDSQGSLTKTAEQLHLHRNAVSYRVQRIFELLDVDPDDPDDRLLLQLACRARAMG